MEFWRTIFFLFKRRSVTAAMLLLALVGAGVGYFLSPTQYVSTATIVLTTPASGGTLSRDPAHPNGLTNPLLNFDDSLRTTAALLIQVLSVPEVTAQIGVGRGSGTTLKVDSGASVPQLLGSNGPFIVIQATSTSPVTARAVVGRAEQRVQEELTSRQKSLNIPPSTYISLVEVVPPSTPETKSTTKLTLAGVGLILGPALGMGGVYWRYRAQDGHRRGQTVDVAAPEQDLLSALPTMSLATASPTTGDRNGVSPAHPDGAQAEQTVLAASVVGTAESGPVQPQDADNPEPVQLLDTDDVEAVQLVDPDDSELVQLADTDDPASVQGSDEARAAEEE